MTEVEDHAATARIRRVADDVAAGWVGFDLLREAVAARDPRWPWPDYTARVELALAECRATAEEGGLS